MNTSKVMHTFTHTLIKVDDAALLGEREGLGQIPLVIIVYSLEPRLNIEYLTTTQRFLPECLNEGLIVGVDCCKKVNKKKQRMGRNSESRREMETYYS